MGTVVWGEDIAEVYDETVATRFDPAVLGPTVDVLAELAGDGPALELAIGTGRVALPLRERGVEVHGIELSPAMAGRLRHKPGVARIPVTIGDMASTRVPGEFSLVYLVFNSIENVTTQDEQVAVVTNAARHLRPGGHLVVEVGVPSIRGVPPGERARAFSVEPDHIGIDTYDDPVGQVLSSHHWFTVGGRLVHHAAPYRWVWPSELDLMARLAGLRLRHRWAGWDRSPFTADSDDQVAVYERTG